MRRDFDVDGFLSRPLVARVATSGPTVRPVWFLWEDGRLWWLTGPWSQIEDHLASDPKVAVVIDTCNLDAGEVKQVRMSGTAELVPYDRHRARRKLRRYLGPEESAWDARFDLDGEDTRFVRFTPRSIEALDLTYRPSQPPEPGTLDDSDDGRQPAPHVRVRPDALDLREVWEDNVPAWTAWARAPGHDSYWRFHGDQFFSLLPPPGGLTLDLGCGEGRVARDLAAAGHDVVGVDVAFGMIRAAADLDPAARLLVADGARLPLADGAFDLVVAFMSLQDMVDPGVAIREARRVLRRDGLLCLAIVHPLNSSGMFTARQADAPFVLEGSYLDPSHYVDDIERDGLPMRFAGFHRPLEHWFADLSGAGFLVEELREPAVPDEAFEDPAGHRWQRIPLFAHIRAVASR